MMATIVHLGGITTGRGRVSLIWLKTAIFVTRRSIAKLDLKVVLLCVILVSFRTLDRLRNNAMRAETVILALDVL